MKKITICSSLKFENEIRMYSEKLELEGNCVFNIVYPTKEKNSYTHEEIKTLGKAHLEKILISDAIFVINKNGYIGESVKKEIDFATTHKKEIIYLENKDEIITKKEQALILENLHELKISEMLKSQYELWEKHKDTWSSMEPISARNSLLWMIDEIGEVIALIKKRGENEIINNKTLKEIFLEELVDVFMYFLDILNRYGFTGLDFSEAYIKKNNKNQTRNYEEENKNYEKR